MSKIEEKLKAYADEMDLHGALTLDDLITSHRYLRAENAKRAEERRAEMQKAREFAATQARQYVLEHEYVSTERMRSMTLQQIVDLIGEG